jgi:hypothetical protein
MKILCICPIGIGNYLLMYPACCALKKKRPESELHLLALRGAIRDLADGDPLWSGLSVIDPTRDPSFSRRTPGSTICCRIFLVSRPGMHSNIPSGRVPAFPF